MRCSFDKLSAITQQTLRQSPTSGHFFVFLNRLRTHVKVLYFDRTGLAVFLYSDTRAMSAIEEHVKNFCGTLITDGYTVYDKLSDKYDKIEHALCWAHTRREFFEAKDYEPQRSEKALELIAKLYQVEA